MDAELTYLAEQRLGRMATIQPDGTLRANPVGYTYNAQAQTIDIGGRAMASSQKFRNILAHGRVAFVVNDIASLDPWVVRCLEIRGDDEALTDPTDSASRFPGAIIGSTPGGSSAGGSIRRIRAAVSVTSDGSETARRPDGRKYMTAPGR